MKMRLLTMTMLALLISLFHTAVTAAPFYTLYFEGVTTSYLSYNTYSYDPTRVELPLSGWVTFDFGNGDYYIGKDATGQVIETVGQQSGGGCTYVINGACYGGDPGPISPFVSAYSIITPFSPPAEIGGAGSPPSLSGGFEPLPDSANYGETANSLGLGQGYSPDWEQAYQVLRYQLRRQYSGEYGSYFGQEIARSFSLLLVSHTDNLFSSIEDLTATPNLDASYVRDVYFSSYTASQFCAGDWWGGSDCVGTGFGPDSFSFHATLTSVAVVAGPATPRQLPEPGSLVLLALVLAGLGLTTRRKVVVAPR